MVSIPGRYMFKYVHVHASTVIYSIIMHNSYMYLNMHACAFAPYQHAGTGMHTVYMYVVHVHACNVTYIHVTLHVPVTVTVHVHVSYM